MRFLLITLKSQPELGPEKIKTLTSSMMHCLRNRGPKLGGHLPDIDKLVLL